MEKIPTGFTAITLQSGKSSWPLKEGDTIVGTPDGERTINIEGYKPFKKLLLKLDDSTQRECDDHLQLRKAWIQFAGKRIHITFIGKVKKGAKTEANYSFAEASSL